MWAAAESLQPSGATRMLKEDRRRPTCANRGRQKAHMISKMELRTKALVRLRYALPPLALQIHNHDPAPKSGEGL